MCDFLYFLLVCILLVSLYCEINSYNSQSVVGGRFIHGVLEVTDVTFQLTEILLAI